MSDTNAVKVVILVRLRSRLSADELTRRYRERMPEFRKLPGLIQKYYLYDEATKELAGLYLWESEEAVQAYLESDLRKTIADAYEAEGPPRVERLNVLDVLR